MIFVLILRPNELFLFFVKSLAVLIVLDKSSENFPHELIMFFQELFFF